ncbi:hypothetical protein Acr_22g0002120 [Actinidia rufa]|uniref:Retrovirus-related Pol polyprotein from transposon TNT 1-94-like beta-barrel domain-containing protein n=1 Tax=Actinidia rufa TaxID=165716 RepID=A0A7J0GJB5_9ERIC|nr:hypothetical protein Acr_22g0002120 [Actinidia rufa]
MERGGRPNPGLYPDAKQDTGGSTTPAYAPVVPPTVTGHGERPEKFSGLDFKYWQQKMLFYLTTLGLAKYLQEEAPTLSKAEKDPTTVAAVQAWKHGDFLCKNYILNGLDKTLYNVYSPLPTAKLLWDSLDKKYKVEDAGAKKFLIGRFLDFKMADSKKVMTQVQDFQLILHELAAEWMALVEELKGMSLEDLIVRLRIEEDNRLNDRKGGYHMESKANMVEHNHKSVNQNKKRKLSGPGQSSVGSNPRQWWVDTGATRHVCCDRELFFSFKETSNGEQLYMGNYSSSKVVGQGTIILKMTSEK